MPNAELKKLDPKQLDERRRAIAIEQERRDRVDAGPARVGAALRDYLVAAGKNVEGDDETLGQSAIDAAGSGDAA